MKVFRKITAFMLIFVGLGTLIILNLFILACGGIKSVFKDKMLKYTVVLDAGHGGIDVGASGGTTGVNESDLNLEICKELQNVFEENGFIVVMTRNDQNGLYGDTSKGFKMRDLNRRLEICKNSGADVFISIHLNSYSSSKRRGAQVFFKEGSEQGKRFADSIQTELNLLKESKRMYDAISGDYYLLNECNITAVIVECGFLSNPEEENLLLDGNYRKKLAKSIFLGTLRYFS